jgi:hypothetical protein
MNFIVLPLSRFQPQPFDMARSFIDWIIFGVIFGIPIAVYAYRYYEVA